MSFCFIFLDKAAGESTVVALFFYSIVTPQCVVEIEKQKSNMNTLTLLDYCLLFSIF